MTRFDRDTDLRSLADGVYQGVVDPSWRIIRGANGGHLAAMLLRGLMLTVDRPPRSLSVCFTSVPREEAIEVRTIVEKAGRSVTFATAKMIQDERVVALGLGAFADGWERPGFDDATMPIVPPPEDLEPVADRDDFPFGRHFDVRRALGPLEPDPSNRAETGVWIRLREQQVADHVVVTQYLDAWAPAIFVKLGEGGGGGVPTIEMTFYYRAALPLPGARPDDWYLATFATTTSRDGLIEEDGTLWSRNGTLIAQSRQLALLT